MGFTAGGILAGSIAAAWQSTIGYVATGSVFSCLQSIATGSIFAAAPPIGLVVLVGGISYYYFTGD